MSKAQKRILCAIGLWLTLIFVTSSFVIPFGVFVRFVQGLNGSPAYKQGFARFWIASWFFIVKGWHAAEYAILVFFTAAVFQSVTKWSRFRCFSAAFMFAVMFAASDEWHQTFVPGRDGCARDVLIDSAGALVAAIILLRKARRLS